MSKCKITGKVLAIQLGRQETQLAVVDKGAQILYSVSVPTPGGAVEDGVIRNGDAVRQMLKEALRRKEFRGVRQAVFALNTSQVITETVSIPELPAAKLEKLLLANMDMYFPVDMHDYRMVWEIVGPKTRDNGLKEVEVQLWAVPAAMLEPYYKAANGCGLSVAAVDYCGHSIATAVGASFARKSKTSRGNKKLNLNMELSFGKKAAEHTVETAEEEESAGSGHSAATELHLTLEQDLLAMTFVQNSQVVFQRLIRCGADPSYQFSEVVMMVEYFRSMDVGRGSILKGIVSGALAGDRPLVAELADMLGIPLSVLDGEHDCKWVICAGAAHTELDFGNPALNRTSDMGKQLKKQLWQYLVLLGGALAFGAVVMFTFTARLGWNSEIQGLKSDMQILNIQAQKTAGYADNYNAYSSAYDAYSDDWNTVFASLQTFNDNLVLVLDELERTLPEDTSVTGIQITEDGLLVDFACETKEEAAYLIMALRRLHYADLVGISDLRGGGSGPATSYGSGEEPPTEGSGDLTAYLNQSDVVNTLYQIGELEKMDVFKSSGYYAAPASATLTGTRTDAQMKAALELLVTNPVAGTALAKAVEKDFLSTTPVLMHMCYGDFMTMMNSGAFNGKTRQEQTEIIVNDILTVDSLPDKNGQVQYTANQRMTGAEKLIAADPELLSWYVYYVNAVAGNGAATAFPYLNMENITGDLVEKGGFSTADADVNDLLNGLISQDAWNYVESLKPVGPGEDPTGPSEDPTEPSEDPTEPSEDPTEPSEDPTEPSEDPTEPGDDVAAQIGALLDQYISNKGDLNNPLATGAIESYLTTGSTQLGAAVDQQLDAYLDSGEADGKIAVLYDDYAADGDTGIPAVNTAIAQYMNGTLQNQKLADAIQRHVDQLGGSGQPGENEGTGLPGDITAKQFQALIKEYLKDGDTGNDEVDALLYDYFTTGQSDNSTANRVANTYIDAGNISVDISIMLNTYITGKKTENPVFDEMMDNWQKNGTTGNARVDTIIDGCLADNGDGDQSDMSNAEIEKMIDSYINNGTTGNPLADALVYKYLTTGTTGNDQMDKILNSYLEDGYLNDDVKALMDKYINTQTTGNKVFDELVKKYLTSATGTTGNKRLDAVIKKALGVSTGTQDGQIDDLIKDLLQGNSGNGGGTAGAPQDTRVVFTAQLGYNNELKEAELIRKGLSEDDKVEKLEVEGE